MKIIKNVMAVVVTLCAITSPVNADELSVITNFREYSPGLASSGQPLETQFEMLRSEGFERIIYLAFTNSGKSIEGEDVIVKDLGMEYVHIPVVWEKPLASDFYAFADVMQRYPDKKTLVHCQVNYRASAFSFLYRVLYEDVGVASAKADMNKVWQPDETWRDLIFSILEENGKSAQCDRCNWDN